jgi:hypothetical protein
MGMVIRAHRASREIKAGCVWINDHIPIISEMPNGEVKQSGYGKDMSTCSFDDYTQVMHVMHDITGIARKDGTARSSGCDGESTHAWFQTHACVDSTALVGG